jgi:hypothetical protein
MSDKAAGQKTRSPEGCDENGPAVRQLPDHVSIQICSFVASGSCRTGAFRKERPVPDGAIDWLVALAKPYVRDEELKRFYRPCRDGHFYLHYSPALRTGLLSSGPSGTCRTLLGENALGFSGDVSDEARRDFLSHRKSSWRSRKP